MQISNSMSNSYNLYAAHNTKQRQNAGKPVKPVNMHNPNFKGSGNLLSDVVWGSMFLDSMGLTNNSSKTNSSAKTNSKKGTDYHTKINPYSLSEQALDRYLRDIKDIKCDGNKISLTTANDETQCVEISESYFDGVEDKEKLVKQWLVDSRENHNFDNVPIEIMRWAKEMRFYYVDNVNMYIERADKAAQKGVELVHYDSDGDRDIKAKFKIDGDEYKFKLDRSCSLLSVLSNSASYDADSYYLGTPGSYIKNIKDLKATVKMTTKDGNEVLVPALKNGVISSLDDINLVKYGNMKTNPELTSTMGAAKTLKIMAGKEISPDNISTIKYMRRKKDMPIEYANNETKECYGFYDKSTQNSYICEHAFTRMDISNKLNIPYSLDCDKIFTVYKKDKDGNVEKFNCAGNGKIILSDEELKTLLED